MMSKKKTLDFSRKELGDGWVVIRGVKCKRMTVFVEEPSYNNLLNEAYESVKRPNTYLNEHVNNNWKETKQ